MESEGGAPLTNEIKIFKHCFMTLLVPPCYRPAAQVGSDTIRNLTSQLCHQSSNNICLGGIQSLIPGTNATTPPPPPPPRLVSSVMVSLSSVKPLQAQTPLAALSARLYFFPLFIVATLVLPLTTSFCDNHVTMKDAGFKSPSLQHHLSQLASSNQ